MAFNGSIIDRFNTKYIPEPNTGCWLWTDYITIKGYGRFSINSKPKAAHRVSYEIYKGKIKKGLHIDHLCRQRCCVNPDHLELVTPEENMRRGKMPELNAKRFAKMSPEEKAEATKGLKLGGRANGDKNLAKTHCPHGHEYTKDNIRKSKTGGRSCKTCHRIRERTRNARLNNN